MPTDNYSSLLASGISRYVGIDRTGFYIRIPSKSIEFGLTWALSFRSLVPGTYSQMVGAIGSGSWRKYYKGASLSLTLLFLSLGIYAKQDRFVEEMLFNLRQKMDELSKQQPEAAHGACCGSCETPCDEKPAQPENSTPGA